MQAAALRVAPLLASLVLALPACGGDEAEESADEASESAADTSSQGPETGTSDDATATSEASSTDTNDATATDASSTDDPTTDTNTSDPTTDTNTTDTSTSDPTTDTGTSDPTTDTDGPLCGDGNVDPGETCDDGNMVDDDSCSNACEWASRIVFITSSVHAGDLGGLAGADALCNTLAGAAELPGTYMAWLSTAEGSPATRFTQSSVPYVTTLGIKVADDWADLSDGSLDQIVAATESGGPIPNADYSCNGTARQSWTGTNPDGTPTANNCDGFTTTAGLGAIGRNSSTMQWSLCNPMVTCAVTAPIYCFQQ
jgi:cysteine-rich repeat protein